MHLHVQKYVFRLHFTYTNTISIHLDKHTIHERKLMFIKLRVEISLATECHNKLIYNWKSCKQERYSNHNSVLLEQTLLVKNEHEWGVLHGWTQLATRNCIHSSRTHQSVRIHVPKHPSQLTKQDAENQYEFIHFHCDSIRRHTFACETNARAVLPYSRRQSTET